VLALARTAILAGLIAFLLLFCCSYSVLIHEYLMCVFPGKVYGEGNHDLSASQQQQSAVLRGASRVCDGRVRRRIYFSTGSDGGSGWSIWVRHICTPTHPPTHTHIHTLSPDGLDLNCAVEFSCGQGNCSKVQRQHDTPTCFCLRYIVMCARHVVIPSRACTRLTGLSTCRPSALAWDWRRSHCC
jgi:hypothetical protein